MNIFFLDADIKKNARYHNNKHVVKMLLEAAQILCTVYFILTGKFAPYKPAFNKHPMVIWTAKTRGNAMYTIKLALQLVKEYKYRYTKPHKCEEVILWCKKNWPKKHNGEFTVPPQCMPEKYKIKEPKTLESTIMAYRNYYIGEKLSFSKWKKRKIPKWIKQKK